MVHARHTEVIASCSELLSLHCPRHPLLRALLPACADPQVFTRQDCPAYAGEPLHTVGLLEAAHQYSLQDMSGSTRTPVPTTLSTQEWQFKNLIWKSTFHPVRNTATLTEAVQTAKSKFSQSTPLLTKKTANRHDYFDSTSNPHSPLLLGLYAHSEC